MDNAAKWADYHAAIREAEKRETTGGYAEHRKSPGFRPMSFTMLQPPCGCAIEGDGNLQSPVRIRFCPTHTSPPAARAHLTTAISAIKWVIGHWGRTEPELSDHDLGHARYALTEARAALAALDATPPPVQDAPAIERHYEELQRQIERAFSHGLRIAGGNAPARAIIVAMRDRFRRSAG